MNQKGVREQNDISIIIGNLPKRLQQKIAAEVGGISVADNNNTEHGATTQKKTIAGGGRKRPDENASNATQRESSTSSGMAAAGGNDVPRIDFFLKMSAKSESETPATLRNKTNEGQACLAVEHDEEKCIKVDGSSGIPGILRLSNTKAAKLTEGVKTVAAARENGRRAARAPRGERSTKADLALPTTVQQQQRHKRFTHPDWFDIVDGSYAQELSQLYDALLTHMQQQTVLEHWTAFCATRQQLQSIFTQLLLHHLKFCCEQKVDNFFWKLLFYNVREYLKQQKPAQLGAKYTLCLLEDGLQFYAELQALLVAKYLSAAAVTSQSAALDLVLQPLRTAHKFEFIAKVAAQKLLICLGDLSRYKAKQLQTNDYTEATNYYQQAQLLIPTNGIPYNQLAIVAIHDRKKFDAIYYHMRSLMSSNAIYSAKESLLVLFDEIRKKYEETELKTSPVHQNANNNSNNNSKYLRKEVWVYPDGVRRLHRTNVNGSKSSLSEENRLNAMTNDDLLRRFISLYLYVIGKLYTGIGMESIQEHQRKLLLHLNCALKRNPLVLTRSRLLKMAALNIFVLQQNMHKDSRREMRYHALNYCNQFFGLVLRKCNQLLAAYLDNTLDAAAQNLTDLNTVLQFIKVYTDFLSQNVHIWEPVRNEEHAFVNCWAELQRLFPELQRIAKQSGKYTPAYNVTLEEDIFLAGFTPLTSSSKHKNSMAAASETAQFHDRIAKIAHFHNCFEQHRKSVELPEESHFVLEQWNAAFKQALDHLQIDEDNSENIVANGLEKQQSANELKLTHATNAEDAQISQLSKLKKELEAKSNMKKMHNAKLEEILKFVDTKVYLEVRPKYLLPDTNCFIDCLEDFERLAKEFKRYTLIIPLTVVKELDGLSKGVKLETYEKSLQKHRIHHFDDVSTRAKKSLNFIKTAKNNVKCATTKGSIINASLFALVEEEHVSNDDKILATAVALSRTMCTETSKDGKCFIQTELVLITTDRNLRVKALSRNLAVSELCEFLQWAKDCSDI